ncbi:unnamed protein product [Echinostoma caproni]|uniref:RanBD1 domain-containing protein n=1 Tax=Echinostoma caproni TaxID=27848 RepID=A0A183ADD4_9TREM|nr:unnamed protein product [Echinostoma caproni]
MDEKPGSASSSTCSSNGSSDMQHPVFRPSILNFPLKPFATPGDSTKPEETSAPSTKSLGLSTSCFLSKPSIAAPPVAAARKDNNLPGGYVFGSNISSRVVNADVSHGASSNLWSTATTEVDSSTSVFTALAKAVASNKRDENGSQEQTLEASASKVTEDQKNATVNLAQVDVFTGEEGEIQVFRMHCQAYVFDTDKQRWNPLGASHFHLNDIPKQSDGSSGEKVSKCRSRVVVRLMSTRRVIINTPVWDTMPVALVDSRSLRIGAVNEDGGHLRSYLFKFSPDDSASKICTALNVRKARAVENAKTEPSPSRLAGQKRSIEAPADDGAPVSSKIPCSSAYTSEALTPKVAPNPSVFRPSILCTSESASTSQHSSVAPMSAGTVGLGGPPL